MKRNLIILILIFMSHFSYSQDQITTLKGKIYECEILSVDTSKIELTTIVSGRRVNSHVKLKEISSYTYRGIYHSITENGEIETTDLSSVKLIKYNFADSIEKTHRYFIYAYSGEITPARIIEYKSPFLGTAHFAVDGKRIQPVNVKFYRDETGFYGNIFSANSLNSSFFERVRHGKINLYEEVTTHHNYGYYRPPSGMSPGSFSPGFTTKRIRNYYNIGFDDLKKANYSNLIIDLADNPSSVMHLNKFKKNTDTQKLLGIAGGGLIIIGFATLINKTKDWDGSDGSPEPNTTGSVVTLVSGAGMIWATYFISLSKPKHLRMAIDAYNGDHTY